MSSDIPAVPEPGPGRGPGPTADDLAAYAVDAHDPADEAALATHLQDVPEAADVVRALRAAAGELAAALVEDVPPPGDLRERVLADARRRRRPAAVVAGASPVDVHRVEVSRVLLLLADLAPGDWERPVYPPEMPGWTVHDVAIHLAANEALLAQRLSVPVRGVPEVTGDNDLRTAQARARHRGRAPSLAVAELAAAAEASSDAAIARGEASLRTPIDWWGRPTPADVALVIRAFESWVHAEDVRRAVGAVPSLPPPASLHTLAHLACGSLPRMLLAHGRGGDAAGPWAGRLLRVRFPDLGGAGWDVDLGGAGLRPAGEGPVDAELWVDAEAFCRRAGRRLPAEELPLTATGDSALVDAVVEALPALAVL